MLLGVALRLTRYLLRFPLWEDEAMLSANLIDRGYAGLLQPLHYCQVAPTLFLWGQLTLVKLLGFNEYVLRLIPFLCGLGGLLLFRHVAGRLLQGTSLVLAVGLFAVAYPMTRYAAEAKPYGCDLLVAMTLLALTIEWLRRPDQTRWLWYLAAHVGPAVGYSFPAIFMAGGVSLVIAWKLVRPVLNPSWKTRNPNPEIRNREDALTPCPSPIGRGECDALTPGPAPRVRRECDALTPGLAPRGRGAFVAWIVFNVVLVASFAAVLIVSKDAVGESNQQTMEETHWANTFPPLGQPLKLPLWLLETHAGAMLGYPVGGPNWGSTFSLLCVVVAVAVLVRRRQWTLLGLLLAPLGLNFIAAALHRFPYGGHARMTLFLAPALCTLIALGLTAALTWIEGRRRVGISHQLVGCVERTAGEMVGYARSQTQEHASSGFGPVCATHPNDSTSVLHPPYGWARYWNACTITLGLFVLLGAGSWLRDVTQPYKSTTTLRAREFAQWFWFEMAHQSELVSCETDWNTDFAPDRLNCGWSSLYFCNQRIYSPRHAHGEQPQLDRVSTNRPLHCVLYRSPKEERESPSPDPQARQKWLNKMQANYDLVALDTYPFAAFDKSDRRQLSDDYVEVFKFVPKDGSTTEAMKPGSMQK